MTSKKTLFVFLMGLAMAPSAFAQTDMGEPNQPEPTIILVPILVSDPELKSGCWVQFYSGRDFKGEVATLIGPAGVETLDKGPARELRREIGSLVLGPNAILTVYEHAFFKDGTVTFPANSSEAGLIKKLGFAGRIESMRLDCTN